MLDILNKKIEAVSKKSSWPLPNSLVVTAKKIAAMLQDAAEAADIDPSISVKQTAISFTWKNSNGYITITCENQRAVTVKLNISSELDIDEIPELESIFDYMSR